MRGIQFTFADGTTITKTSPISMTLFLYRFHPTYVSEWLDYEENSKNRWRSIEAHLRENKGVIND